MHSWIGKLGAEHHSRLYPSLEHRSYLLGRLPHRLGWSKQSALLSRLLGIRAKESSWVLGLLALGEEAATLWLLPKETSRLLCLLLCWCKKWFYNWRFWLFLCLVLTLLLLLLSLAAEKSSGATTLSTLRLLATEQASTRLRSRSSEQAGRSGLRWRTSRIPKQSPLRLLLLLLSKCVISSWRGTKERVLGCLFLKLEVVGGPGGVLIGSSCEQLKWHLNNKLKNYKL